MSVERLTTYRKDGRAAIANKDGASPLEQTMKIPAVIDRLAAYEDTGLEPEELMKAMEDCADTVAENQWAIKLLNEIGGNIDHIRELAEADKDGRCVVLPCKVGDTVWTNFSVQGSYPRKTDRPYECKVLFVGLNESACGGYINFEYVKSGYQFPMDFDQIGKTVFLTREGAEKALEDKP